jgi:hypothetical protein
MKYYKNILRTIWEQIIDAMFPPIPCVWSFERHINCGFAYYSTECGERWAIDVVKPLDIKYCPICGKLASIDIEVKQ